jgi:non-heme chloroperoxidase
MHARPEGFDSLQEAADAVAAFLPDRPRPIDLSGLAKNLRRGPDGRLRWHWDPRWLEAGNGHTDAIADLAEAARRIAVPTLVIRGRSSDVVSSEGLREFRSLVPHAEYDDVEGAGHMVAGDRNDAFTDAVVSFLLRVVRGA